MGTITGTRIHIYGKNSPNRNLFNKILDRIYISQIKGVYIQPIYEEEKFKTVFRAAYGFDSKRSSIEINKPTKKEITDLTEKMWDGLEYISFSGIGETEEDHTYFSAHINRSEIICKEEPLNARDKKIIQLGFQEYKEIVSIDTCIPELIPRETINKIQNVIKVLSPSDNYCVDFCVLRNDVGRNQILTLEELLPKLDSYKTKR